MSTGELPPAEDGRWWNIIRRVRKFVAAMHRVPEEEITLDTPLLPDAGYLPEGQVLRDPSAWPFPLQDLSADSLDVVELVMAVEEEFGIELRDHEAAKLTLAMVARWTVRDLVNFIARVV